MNHDDDTPQDPPVKHDRRSSDHAIPGLKGRQFGGQRRGERKPTGTGAQPESAGAVVPGSAPDAAEPSGASSTGGSNTTGPDFGATKVV